VVSVLSSLQTGHWFATPFALLFTVGYGYVSLLVASEQVLGWQRARALASSPPHPLAQPGAGASATPGGGGPSEELAA